MASVEFGEAIGSAGTILFRYAFDDGSVDGDKVMLILAELLPRCELE
jgi:hypothetical protein